MKREDLYRMRGQKYDGETYVRTGRAQRAGEQQGLYPALHFFQVVCAIVLLLTISCRTYIFPEKAPVKVEERVKTELEATIRLSEREWSGSLKELFVLEK